MLRISSRASHDDTTTAGTSALGFSVCGVRGLAAFGIFLLDVVLWLDGHVQDIGRVASEFIICAREQN